MSPMRIWVASLLIAVGALWLSDAVGVLSAGRVIDTWWPVALIGLAVIAAATERRIGLGPAALFAVGLVLLADQLDGVDVSAVLWPVVAVFVGIWLLLHRGRWHGVREDVADRQDVVALLGASTSRNRSAHFRRANVTAVFGGATLDLREAHLEPGARVDALALFGGVEVVVPEGWRVTISGLPIFGGYQDKTHGAALPLDAPVLHVSATAIFGGVEAKHTVPVG